MSLIDPVRRTYHVLRAGYRKVRALRNRLLNLIDRPLVILIYHRVADLPSDPEMLAVSPANFRRQMEFLKQRFPIARFDEEWSALRKPAVVITFDDGYADNLHAALPILEELEVPATFFVSTGHIGTSDEFWWHRLERILLREGEFPLRFALHDERHGGSWETATMEQRRGLYAALNARMQRVLPDRREAWFRQLASWTDTSNEGNGAHRSMTREEVRRLAASPWVTIGAHTVSHPALAFLTEEQQHQEILSAKQELEGIIGAKITTFSYPFGRKSDYNRTSVRLCREVGFTKAASNFPGQVHHWTDPLQLPRHLVRDWDQETFAAGMRTFWSRG